MEKLASAYKSHHCQLNPVLPPGHEPTPKFPKHNLDTERFSGTHIRTRCASEFSQSAMPAAPMPCQKRSMNASFAAAILSTWSNAHAFCVATSLSNGTAIPKVAVSTREQSTTASLILIEGFVCSTYRSGQPEATLPDLMRTITTDMPVQTCVVLTGMALHSHTKQEAPLE